MRRRNFLAITGSSVAAIPLACLSTFPQGLFASTAPVIAGRFALARLCGDNEEFIPLSACAQAACTGQRVSIRLDALHVAEAGLPALAALRVHALFDTEDGQQAPYIAWDFRADSPHGSSRATSFAVNRESMRGFALDYRMQSALPSQADERMHCALTRLDSPLLQPGSYILAGPRRDGRVANLRAYRHASDAATPLQARYGQQRDFDYLTFRITEVA